MATNPSKTRTPWRPRLKRGDVFMPGRLPLRVLRRDPQPDFDPHSHEGFHELVLVLGGQGLHRTGGVSTPLAAGDVFVIHGEREHRYLKTRGLALVNVVFGPELLRLLADELHDLPGFRALFELEPGVRQRGEFRQFMRLDAKRLGRLLPLVDAIEAEAEGAEPGYQACAKGALLQLAGLLARWYAQDSGGEQSSDPLVAVARVLSRLERGYAEPIALPELCGLAGMSERSLRRHFTRLVGSNPAAYLLKVRLNAAKGLLKDPRRSVTQAAMEAGFSDPSYFARQFRRSEGLSPRRWRAPANKKGRPE